MCRLGLRGTGRPARSDGLGPLVLSFRRAGADAGIGWALARGGESGRDGRGEQGDVGWGLDRVMGIRLGIRGCGYAGWQRGMDLCM